MKCPTNPPVITGTRTRSGHKVPGVRKVTEDSSFEGWSRTLETWLVFHWGSGLMPGRTLDHDQREETRGKSGDKRWTGGRQSIGLFEVLRVDTLSRVPRYEPETTPTKTLFSNEGDRSFHKESILALSNPVVRPWLCA